MMGMLGNNDSPRHRAPTRHTLEKERAIRSAAITALIQRVQSLEMQLQMKVQSLEAQQNHQAGRLDAHRWIITELRGQPLPEEPPA